MKNITLNLTMTSDDDSYTYKHFDILADNQPVGEMSVMDGNDGTAYVERIDIEEDQRNNGFGTAALYEISSQYDELLIAADNEDAARLYDRIGSESRAEVADYIDQGYGVYQI